MLADWLNDPKFMGEYESQETVADLQKSFSRPGSQWFFVMKKDGSRIGWAAQYFEGSQVMIGFGIVPNQRGKGYATEAATIIVDYLFLTKNIVRIQADTSTMERFIPLQHFKGRMERTEDIEMTYNGNEPS